MATARREETERDMLLEALITQGCTVEAAQLIVRHKARRDGAAVDDPPLIGQEWGERTCRPGVPLSQE